jgi:hypothetical protein
MRWITHPVVTWVKVRQVASPVVPQWLCRFIGFGGHNPLPWKSKESHGLTRKQPATTRRRRRC